jgi:hypothetical protein
MKKHPVLLSLAIFCALGLAVLTVSRAAVEPVPATTFQYATIECVPAGGGGAVKVHVVRPDGKVEFYDDRLVPGKVPEGCSQRAYFMNVVMNLLAKEGYEFAGMEVPESGARIGDLDLVVMKKAERH